nr:hypothetical protein [Tanacetum cinerariifolium]
NQVAQNPRVQNVGNQNGLIGVQGNGNQNQIGNGDLVAARAEGNATGQNGNQIRCYNCRGVGHYARNCTVRPRRMDAAYLQTQLLIARKEEAGIQLQAEEYDLMAAAADLDEIEKVNANCILMANLQQASTSGTQTDSDPVYDTDGSAEYNQKEVDELKAERLAKTQDPLALMANSNNPYVFPAPRQDQPSFNQNYLQQPMTNPKDITDPTTTMNMALTLMAKAFKLNYSTPTNNNQRISSNPRNRQIAQPEQNAGNPAGYNDVIGNQVIQNVVQNLRVQNVARAEGNTAGQNGNQIRCYNCRGVEEQYTELLEPIPESHQVPQNDNDVISEDTNVEQGGETVEQHPVNFKETRALYESLYQNLAIEVEKVNSV